MSIKQGLAIVFILVVAACSKSNHSPTTYFQFDVNDTTYKLDSFNVIFFTAPRLDVGMNIQSISEQSFIWISLFPKAGNLQGTYVNYPVPPSDTLFNLYVGIGKGLSARRCTMNATIPFTFTIENDDQHFIEGYFSGTVPCAEGFPDIAVTNGKFRMPYTTQ